MVLKLNRTFIIYIGITRMKNVEVGNFQFKLKSWKVYDKQTDWNVNKQKISTFSHRDNFSLNTTEDSSRKTARYDVSGSSCRYFLSEQTSSDPSSPDQEEALGSRWCPLLPHLWK